MGMFFLRLLGNVFPVRWRRRREAAHGRCHILIRSEVFRTGKGEFCAVRRIDMNVEISILSAAAEGMFEIVLRGFRDISLFQITIVSYIESVSYLTGTVAYLI